MELSASRAVPKAGGGAEGDSPHTVIRTRAASSSSLLRGGKVAAGGGAFPGAGTRWGGQYLSREVSRKGEALAVAGLAQFGESLELIAPVEILKDLFKLPYTHAPLSVCIHRVGATLVLSAGSEGESTGPAPESEAVRELGSSLVSRLLCHDADSNQRDGSSSSSNNTRGVSEGTHAAQSRPSLQRLLASGQEGIDGKTASQEGLVFGSFDSVTLHHYSAPPSVASTPSCTQGGRGDASRDRQPAGTSGRSAVPGAEGIPGGGGPGGWGEGHGFQAGQAKPVGEPLHGSRAGDWDRDGGEGGKEAHEEEAQGQGEGEGEGEYPFPRVVLWHFGPSWRMLLGSDLVVFTNKDHSAVSLHLVELRLEASPLLWLDIWLENVMAGISEVAICYHCNETVHGYELLRTDDISQIKALTRDGSPSFQPAVVERCASLVLDFLRDNCTRTPATYLLSKRSGDGALQLHDLTQTANSTRGEGSSRELARTLHPAPGPRASRSSLPLPLAMIMYRLAQKLSQRQPQAPSDQHRSAHLFLQALQFLDDESHPGICAVAHEFIADHCLRYTCALGAPLSPLLDGPQDSLGTADPVSMHQGGPLPEAASAPLPPAEQQTTGGAQGQGEALPAPVHTARVPETPAGSLSAHAMAGTRRSPPQGRSYISLSEQSVAPVHASIPMLSLDSWQVAASIPKPEHPALPPFPAKHMAVQPDVPTQGVARSCHRAKGHVEAAPGCEAAGAGEEECLGAGGASTDLGGGRGPELGWSAGGHLDAGGENEPAAGAVQAVEACLAAVAHASRAIKALQARRRLLQTPLEWRSPFPSRELLATLASSAAAGECLCGEPDCLPLPVPGAVPRTQADNAGQPMGHALAGRSRLPPVAPGAGLRPEKRTPEGSPRGTAKVQACAQEEQHEARVCALVVVLAESYLRLARALAAEGDEARALRSAEIVCLLLGGVPLPEEEGVQGLAAPQEGPPPAATKRASKGIPAGARKGTAKGTPQGAVKKPKSPRTAPQRPDVLALGLATVTVPGAGTSEKPPVPMGRQETRPCSSAAPGPSGEEGGENLRTTGEGQAGRLSGASAAEGRLGPGERGGSSGPRECAGSEGPGVAPGGPLDAKAARMSRACRLVSRSGKSFLGQAWLLAGEMFVAAAKKRATSSGGSSALGQAGESGVQGPGTQPGVASGLGHGTGQSPAGEVRAPAASQGGASHGQAEDKQAWVGAARAHKATEAQRAAPLQAALGILGAGRRSTEDALRVDGHVVEEVRRARKRNHLHLRHLSPSMSAPSSTSDPSSTAREGEKGHTSLPNPPATWSSAESPGASRGTLLPGRQRGRGRSKGSQGRALDASRQEWEDEDECFACCASRCSCLGDRAASGMSASTSSPGGGGPRGPSPSASSSWSTGAKSGLASGSARGGSGVPSSRPSPQRGFLAPAPASTPVHASMPAPFHEPSAASALRFGHPVPPGPISGLAAAADLFSRSAEAFISVGDHASASDAWRKEGWCSNELGRALGSSSGEPGACRGGRGEGAAAGSGARGAGIVGALDAGVGRGAGEWFLRASDSFRRAGDTANCVVSLCNLGHSQRAAAEGLAAKLGPLTSHPGLAGRSRGHLRGGTRMGAAAFGADSSKMATGRVAPCEAAVRSLPHEQELVAFAARCAYAGALKWYGEARAELLRSGDGVALYLAGPWQEAHKQLAHTYLRLGLFLAQLDSCEGKGKQRAAVSKHGEAGSRREGALSTHAGGRSTQGGVVSKQERGVNQGLEAPPEDDPLTAAEALGKAIMLYESLGQSCAQEAAYAHYQLGVVLQKEALGKVTEGGPACAAGGELPGQPSDKPEGREESSEPVAARNLAGSHFERALEFYSGDQYLDMFVQICVERSRLELQRPRTPGREGEASMHILVALKRLMAHAGLGSEEPNASHGPPEQKAPSPARTRLHDATLEALQSTLQEVLRTALTHSIKAASQGEEQLQGRSLSSDIECSGQRKGQAPGDDLNRVPVKELRKAYRLALCGSLDNVDELGDLVEALCLVVHH